jgi:hypothetical protein
VRALDTYRKPTKVEELVAMYREREKLKAKREAKLVSQKTAPAIVLSAAAAQAAKKKKKAEDNEERSNQDEENEAAEPDDSASDNADLTVPADPTSALSPADALAAQV